MLDLVTAHLDGAILRHGPEFRPDGAVSQVSKSAAARLGVPTVLHCANTVFLHYAPFPQLVPEQSMCIFQIPRPKQTHRIPSPAELGHQNALSPKLFFPLKIEKLGNNIKLYGL